MLDNLIAIVGRPNVGKSTLFNRLTGARAAIEEKRPGVTRDRLYGFCQWNGRNLVVVDTGGITFGGENSLENEVRKQAEAAVAESSVIIFLLDGKEGLTALDEEIAHLLRLSNRPVVPVVNKLDSREKEEEAYNFFRLGFGQPLALSAAHGRGTGDLLDLVCSLLPKGESSPEPYPEETLKIAVIGRPNAGKSSLVNRLLGTERVIVDAIPGTTREAVDTFFYYGNRPCLLIDTAGIRRKSKVKDAVEYYSVLRAFKAVERADVALLVLDATLGIGEQDQRLAGFVHRAGKGLILVQNKWDLVRRKGIDKEWQEDEGGRNLDFVSYAPTVRLSALTGRHCDRIWPLIEQVNSEQCKRLPTSLLNELLADILAVNPPASSRGRAVKLFYVTQPAVKPPTFVFFTNDPEGIHFSYRRYLENRLRQAFQFKGTPLVIKFKPRERGG